MLNEGALCRAMKRAYRSTGYDVTNGGGIFYIRGDLWMAEIQWASVPGKVMGLIAEHLRGMPEPGETYHLQSGEEPQLVFPDTAKGDLDRWRFTDSDVEGSAKRTAVQIGGIAVYQDPDSLRCYGVEDALTEVTWRPDCTIYTGGRCVWDLSNWDTFRVQTVRPVTGPRNRTMVLWEALESMQLP